jgi:hypothetical protein
MTPRTLPRLVLRVLVAVAAALALPLVAGGQPAGAQARLQAMTITGIQTPTGNIQCMYVKDGASESLRCTVLVSTAAIGPKPASCEFDWGTDVGMDRTGRAQRLCISDTVAGRYPSVAYGTTWRKGAFTCTSALSGLTCRNLSKHGWTISKAKQTIF